jgi:uncharacterized protein (TIGR02270 family)
LELSRPRVLIPVLRAHFDELDYLWERRERSAFDPVWNLGDLAELERRAFAHLRGLVLGQAHTVDIAREALASDDPTAVAASTFALFELGPETLRDEVLAAVSSESEGVADGVRTALRHRPLAESEDRLRAHPQAREPGLRARANDVLSFHRATPIGDIDEDLRHDEETVRRLAIVAAGRLARPFDTAAVEREFDGSRRSTVQAALEAASRSGAATLLDGCREAGERADAIPDAIRFLGVLGEAEDTQRLIGMLEDPKRAVYALEALGALGDPAGVPAILEALADPALHHAAAAAFLRITGAEKVSSDARIEPPDDMSSEDAEFWDDHMEVEPSLGRSWWASNLANFPGAGRWQQGLEVSSEPLGALFSELTLQSRRDVYLRTRWRDPANTPDLELERTAMAQLGLIS